MRNILRRWLPKHRKTSDAARSWIWDRNTFVHRAYHQASSSHRDHPIKASKFEKSEAGKRRKKKGSKDARDVHEHSISAFLMLLSQSYVGTRRRKEGRNRSGAEEECRMFMCSYPPENFSSSFSSNRFLCSSFDSVSFLLPRERASELREAISKEALFFFVLGGIFKL